MFYGFSDEGKEKSQRPVVRVRFVITSTLFVMLNTRLKIVSARLDFFMSLLVSFVAIL